MNQILGSKNKWPHFHPTSFDVTKNETDIVIKYSVFDFLNHSYYQMKLSETVYPRIQSDYMCNLKYAEKDIQTIHMEDYLENRIYF